MPRTARIAPGGMVFHVLNRRVGRHPLFHSDGEYQTFENVLVATATLFTVRVCAYCVMPNHWHMILRPTVDGEMSEFMHRITGTHTMKWKARNDAHGDGHLYQNRFKSFPVQSDQHYLRVVRYVERNALRANLVERAEKWRYSSLSRRTTGAIDDDFLSAGPIRLPSDWVDRVNQPETAAELKALRAAVRRGRPYGGESWTQQTARELGLESTLRPRGRPKERHAAPRLSVDSSD